MSKTIGAYEAHCGNCQWHAAGSEAYCRRKAMVHADEKDHTVGVGELS